MEKKVLRTLWPLADMDRDGAWGSALACVCVAGVYVRVFVFGFGGGCAFVLALGR